MRLEGDTSDVPASAAAAEAASKAGDAASDALRLLMLALLSCSASSLWEAVGGCHVILCLPLLSVPPVDCSELSATPAVLPAAEVAMGVAAVGAGVCEGVDASAEGFRRVCIAVKGCSEGRLALGAAAGVEVGVLLGVGLPSRSKADFLLPLASGGAVELNLGA